MSFRRARQRGRQAVKLKHLGHPRYDNPKAIKDSRVLSYAEKEREGDVFNFALQRHATRVAAGVEPPVAKQVFPDDKGKLNGRCNRGACLALLARGGSWFNKATHAFYCAKCARLLNDANKNQCVLYTPDGKEATNEQQ